MSYRTFLLGAFYWLLDGTILSRVKSYKISKYCALTYCQSRLENFPQPQLCPYNKQDSFKIYHLKYFLKIKNWFYWYNFNFLWSKHGKNTAFKKLIKSSLHRNLFSEKNQNQKLTSSSLLLEFRGRETDN